MALIPLTNDKGDVHLAYDSDTHELVIVKGGGPGDYEVIGPAIQVTKPALDLAAELQSLPVAVAGAATEEVIPAPGTGKAIWIYGHVLAFGATGTYQWLSALHALTGNIDVGAVGVNDGILPVTGWPHLKCGPAAALNATTVGAGATIEGWITYRIVGA